LGPLSGRRVRLREVKADLWGSTTELLTKAMDQGDIDVALSDEDQERLVQFLVRSGYLDSDDHLYRPPTSRGSEDRYDLSALLQSGFGARARSLNQETGGPAPLFQPIGGMQEIAFAFQRELQDRLTFNAEVVSVRQTEGEVRVVWRDTRTGQEHQEVADYVVCCLPMSILKKIDVNFSPEMAASVQETGHAAVAKMGLQMGRRFWEEDEGIFGGHLWSRSLQLGEFSYPCNDYFGAKGVLLGYYGSSLQAGLADMPTRGRIEHVLTQASKVHPQMREEFERAYCVWWEKIPYSEGAYGRSPGQELLAKLSEPDGRLYIGCAGASPDPAWMEGAVEAAWRSVEALHTRVMRG
jgi:monoamine oxidase